MNSNPVVHFEMPYEDQERVAKFYEKAFGWKMDKFGKDMGNYVTAETTETANRRPVTPGAINGGFFPKGPDSAAHPSVVVSTDDIEAAMQSVRDAGGKVVGEPVKIPGIGLYVHFTDSEGNDVSLLQP